MHLGAQKPARPADDPSQPCLLSMPSATLEPQIAPFRVRNAERGQSRGPWPHMGGRTGVGSRPFLLTCLMGRLSGPEPAPEGTVLETLGLRTSEGSCFSSLCRGNYKGSSSWPGKADSVTRWLTENPAGPGGGNSNS